MYTGDFLYSDLFLQVLHPIKINDSILRIPYTKNFYWYVLKGIMTIILIFHFHTYLEHSEFQKCSLEYGFLRKQSEKLPDRGCKQSSDIIK